MSYRGSPPFIDASRGRPHKTPRIIVMPAPSLSLSPFISSAKFLQVQCRCGDAGLTSTVLMASWSSVVACREHRAAAKGRNSRGLHGRKTISTNGVQRGEADDCWPATSQKGCSARTEPSFSTGSRQKACQLYYLPSGTSMMRIFFSFPFPRLAVSIRLTNDFGNERNIFVSLQATATLDNVMDLARPCNFAPCFISMNLPRPKPSSQTRSHESLIVDACTMVPAKNG